MDAVVRAVAYVSWGRWVADCPAGCGYAEQYGIVNPVTGYIGGLKRDSMRCSGCGWVGPSEWPGNAEDIWYVLSLRPAERTRNWSPPETLEDLLAENVGHGILPPEVVAAVEAGVSGVLMSSADGQLSAGPALAGAARLAIGGGV